MKLGNNFGFWVRVVMAILKAVLPFGDGSNPSGRDAGERVCRAVLDQVVKNNEDDDLKSVADAESLA